MSEKVNQTIDIDKLSDNELLEYVSGQLGKQFKRNEPDNTHLILQVMEKIIPRLAGIMDRLDDSGSTSIELIHLKQHFKEAVCALDPVKAGLKDLSLGLNALNFLELPLTYLAALYLGKQDEMPFTMTNGLKLLYGAVGLGLGIAVLAAPLLAPVLVIISSAVSVGWGIYTMFNFFRERKKTREELGDAEKALKKACGLEENVALNDRTLLKALEKKGNDFQDKLLILKKDYYDPNSPADESELIEKIKKLNAKHVDLQSAYDKQVKLQKTLEKMGKGQVFDKSIGLSLSLLALAAVVINLLFPVVGVAMLATAAAIGGAYLIGRVLVPWLKKKFSKSEPKPTEMQEAKQTDVHESTTDMSIGLEPNLDRVKENLKNNVELGKKALTAQQQFARYIEEFKTHPNEAVNKIECLYKVLEHELTHWPQKDSTSEQSNSPQNQVQSTVKLHEFIQDYFNDDDVIKGLNEIDWNKTSAASPNDADNPDVAVAVAVAVTVTNSKSDTNTSDGASSEDDPGDSLLTTRKE